MNDPLKQIERALFEAALSLPDAEVRKAFLEETFGGNARLRKSLEELLDAHARANWYLDMDPLQATAPERGVVAGGVPETCPPSAENPREIEGADVRIGRYKLIKRMGEGGCGVVYLAEQEEPVQRKVALKIIRLGMDTERVIARFEMERQALALMNHPNIAQVLDAGATETGRSYFVMELVPGVRITDYCDQHQLDIPSRLELFIEVCQAIQHAHQKGILHRDIKPSNILVMEHGEKVVPKVIDFGIAKAIEGPLGDRRTVTFIEQFIGTPAYMSPEQAETGGIDVDTRSDIYSLGALLYELLTGRPPFDTDWLLGLGVEQMRRELIQKEPLRPSKLLLSLESAELEEIARKRRCEPARLIAGLKGDLDWIVTTAMEKDRQRRYATVNGLAVDVQRYLRNQPVSARPPSRWYALGKLVRRNRAAFAAGAAVAAALVIGLGTSTVLFLREREARWEAEQARRAESTLRTASEARANIARAAYLLSHGRNGDANALVEKIPISIDEPSLEAANVYRTLAIWNLSQNRWKMGARQLLDVIHANQMDKTDMTWEATRDSLIAGPALVFAGNLEDYHRLVQEMIARFAGTQYPVAAEQVLKLSLILPVDATTLRSLDPVANVARKSLETEKVIPENNYLLAWRAFAIALFEYRAGHFEDAVAMARRCLGFSETQPAAIAMAHLVMGMALRQLHREPEASSEIRAGEAMVRAKIPIDAPPQIWGDEFWYDWIFAQILLREAESTSR